MKAKTTVAKKHHKSRSKNPAKAAPKRAAEPKVDAPVPAVEAPASVKEEEKPAVPQAHSIIVKCAATGAETSFLLDEGPLSGTLGATVRLTGGASWPFTIAIGNRYKVTVQPVA